MTALIAPATSGFHEATSRFGHFPTMDKCSADVASGTHRGEPIRLLSRRPCRDWERSVVVRFETHGPKALPLTRAELRPLS